MSNQISDLTRRNLLDEFLIMGDIAGRLDLVSFLKGTGTLDAMPSTDGRFTSASDDIRQHMIKNYDWDDNFLYWDYLELKNVPDEIFNAFIEQVVHPIVRADKEEQQKYVEVVNKHIEGDGFQLQVIGDISGYPVYNVIRIRGGVQGNVKNLIFAADGPKPEIVLADSVNNDILITKNSEHCLVFEKSIPPNGLQWKDLVKWWQETNELVESEIEIERSLYMRLYTSLDSVPEKLLFRVYFDRIRPLLGDKLPALIPQVYLHYDPYTMKQLKGQQRLARQRMDFLLLLTNRERIVIEIDGKQHYSDGEKADTNKYSEMVSADRELKLRGYEVYRFGGAELSKGTGEEVTEQFFIRLFRKHAIFD